MGEAKRRKKLDPSYGNYQFHIQRSQSTNNYLVMLKGYICDSTINLEEAQQILEWFQTEATIRPPGRKVIQNPKLMEEWVLKSPRLKDYPESTAEILVFNRDTNSFTTELSTVSPGDLLQQATKLFSGQPRAVVAWLLDNPEKR